MDFKSVYCNNCGGRGHLYRDCKKPVSSYGNIIYKIENDIPKILMIQRKDSLCFIEFIRGKYDVYNYKYIQVLINKCSLIEKEKLLNNTFSKLWKELWLIDHNNYEQNHDYIKAKDKYNLLKKGYTNKNNNNISLIKLIELSKTNYIDSEWEFPKGRRNRDETNLQCAKREFMEETNYNDDDYILIQNINPFCEEFIGENKVRYKYIYYIGILTNCDKDICIDKNNKDQITEIKNIKWLDKNESLNIIRNYHHTRKDVINKIFNLIDSINNNDYSLI
jgi:8-oxo-dGTP pyrophosphatase MutT (NUDIX family)